MILQLDPPIPMTTPKGEGLAYFMESIGPDYDYAWTVIHEDGEIWTFRNKDVSGVKNITLGRTKGRLGLNGALSNITNGDLIPTTPGKIVEWPKDL